MKKKTGPVGRQNGEILVAQKRLRIQSTSMAKVYIHFGTGSLNREAVTKSVIWK
jgi:hypothetical protein